MCVSLNQDLWTYVEAFCRFCDFPSHFWKENSTLILFCVAVWWYVGRTTVIPTLSLEVGREVGGTSNCFGWRHSVGLAELLLGCATFCFVSSYFFPLIIDLSFGGGAVEEARFLVYQVSFSFREYKRLLLFLAFGAPETASLWSICLDKIYKFFFFPFCCWCNFNFAARV